MSRKEAREKIFSIIFQWDLGKTGIDDFAEEYLEETSLADEDEKKYIFSVVNGIVSNKEKLDELICRNLRGWTFDRISAVDRNILRMAAFEIVYAKDIPDAVAANEAVEMAKIYGSENSSSFVNGVIGSIISEKK